MKNFMLRIKATRLLLMLLFLNLGGVILAQGETRTLLSEAPYSGSSPYVIATAEQLTTIEAGDFIEFTVQNTNNTVNYCYVDLQLASYYKILGVLSDEVSNKAKEVETTIRYTIEESDVADIKGGLKVSVGGVNLISAYLVQSPRVPTVRLSPSNLSLGTSGDAETITASLKYMPDTYTGGIWSWEVTEVTNNCVTWTASTTNTFDITPSEENTGTAKVTATYSYNDGTDKTISATCDVTVEVKPSLSLSIDGHKTTKVYVPQKTNYPIPLTVNVKNPEENCHIDMDGFDWSLVYENNQLKVHHENSSGPLHTVNVKYVNSSNQVLATKKLTVVIGETISGYAIEPTNATINVGATRAYSVSGNGDTSVAWTTDDGTIATVNTNGVVTGVAEGTTSVNATVTAFDGTTAYLDIYLTTNVTVEYAKVLSGTFGSSSTFNIDDATVVIELKEAGDLAALATLVAANPGIVFNDARLVRFVTAAGKSMNGTDFENMNLFGKTQSVILDFTYATVTPEARQSAVLNSHGVVIGTARAADPQTTFALYDDDARAKINAMLNITDTSNDTKLNTLEIFAETNAVAPQVATLKGLVNELIKAYPDIDDVKIQGAAFNDNTSNEWLTTVCSAFSDATNVTTFRVYEYTLKANTTVALVNPNIKHVDFAYLWDDGNGTTASLNLTGLSALETADVKLANLKKVELCGLANLQSVDVTAANSGMEVDITGCGTAANPVQIVGGLTFRGTITPETSGTSNTYYTLKDDSQVAPEWQNEVTFGTGSTYQFGYEKTVVKINIANAGDLALLTDADLFARARVVSISTADNVKLSGTDLANLKTFGTKGDVNIDFTNARVDDYAWENAVYPTNPTLLFTPGSARPRTFYKSYIEPYAYKDGTNGGNVKGVANIYDSSNNGVRNTIEVYGAAAQPVSLARRLMRLYPGVTELVVHGKINQWTQANDCDDVQWLQMLCAQLAGIKEITSLTVFSYNFGTVVNNDTVRGGGVLVNPNLKHVDFSDAINGETMDLRGCPNLETAVFMGTDGHDLNITGLRKLKELNFTKSKNIRLVYDAEAIDSVEIYGCEYLANHSDLHHAADGSDCLGDLPLPYYLDPKTDLDITIDLDLGRQWHKFGSNPRSLRELLKYIRTDLARKGDTNISKADPNKRYNYVKLVGKIRPNNMGALNMYVHGDKVLTTEGSEAIGMNEKFDEGDIVCRYLDLSEAQPFDDDLTTPISWLNLLRSKKAIGDVPAVSDASGIGVHTAAVDYVILPPGLDKTTINAETFKGFLNLSAAGSHSADSTTLVAYVNKPGTLYGLTAYMRELSTTDMTSAQNYVCNDRDGGVHGGETITDPITGEVTKFGYKHWMWIAEPNKLKKVVLSGNINAFDITNGCTTGNILVDGHLVALTSENEHLNVDYDTFIESVQAADGQYGTKGALSGANLYELDLIDATVDGPEDDLKISAMNIFKDGEKNQTTVINEEPYITTGYILHIPKNTTVLPEGFLSGKAGFTEICIPNSVETIKTKAFYGTNLNHLYTTDPDDNIIDKAGIYAGTYTTGGIAKVEGSKSITDDLSIVDGVYTFSANLKKIETSTFTTVGISDVYVLATTAPICEVDAFNTATYCSNNSYTMPGQGQGIVRTDYNNNGGMAVLHYPAEATVENKKKYTDITREYSITDRDGRLDGNGKTIMWPNQTEFNRAYTQARGGYLWKAWDNTRDESYKLIGYNYNYKTGETVEEAQDKVDAIYADNTYPDKIKEIFYDADGYDRFKKDTIPTIDNGGNLFTGEDYRGWHQFVLTEAAGNGPQKFAFDWIVDNNWWTICVPFDMTLGDLRKVFGHKHEDNDGTEFAGEEHLPIVSQLTRVIRSENGGTMKEETTEFEVDKNTVLLYFCDDLVQKAMKTNNIQIPKLGTDGYPIRDEYGEIQTIDGTEDERDKQVVIQAGRPYLIKPYMLLDNDTPAETAIMTMSDNVDPKFFEFAERKKNLYLGQRDIRVEDLNGKELTPSSQYTYTFAGCYSGWYYPKFSFYLGLSSKLSSGVVLKRLLSTPKITGKRSWRSYSAIILVNWGVTGGGTLHDKTLPEREALRKVVTDAYTTGGVTHWKMWGESPDDSESEDDSFKTGSGAGTAKNNIVVCFGDFNNESNDPAKIDGVEIGADSNITIITRQKVYNLNGQLMRNGGDLSNLPQGCYIINGKKYIVK